MYTEWVRKINAWLESDYNGKLVIDKVNDIIPQLNTSEQLGIHSDLSDASLEAIYKYRNELIFIDSAKEHIVWFYFHKLVENIPSSISDTLLNDILEEYVRVRYLALESILIGLIMKEKITQEQLDKNESIFQSKAFRKQLLCREARIQVRTGVVLNKESVQKLLEVTAYDVLERAIDANTITEDAYSLFVCPSQGESHRKAKQRLFDKIQSLKGQ